MIIGAGGLAREVLESARAVNAGSQLGFEVLGFVARDVPLTEPITRTGLNLLGMPEDPLTWSGLGGASAVVAIGDAPVRRRLTAVARAAGLSMVSVIHPTSILGEDVVVEVGCVILPGVVITSNVVLGEGSIVNPGTSISHDCTVGSYSLICPGVRLCGSVRVGDDAFIGSGAVVLPGVRIGEGARVGAGAVVTGDVPPGTTVVGVPAREVAKHRGIGDH